MPSLRTPSGEVIALADELDPPDEKVEGFVVMAAIQHGQAVPADLADRVAVSRFMEQFPDSEMFQALSIEEFERFLHHDLPEQTKHIDELGSEMLSTGQLPSAVLAAVIGTDLGSLWMRLSGLAGVPAGYSNDQLDDLERQDAVAALGGAVLWDPTSIFVVGHVAHDFSDDIRTSFPSSSITQSGLDDIAQGARVQAARPTDGERQELSYNATLGKPELINWDADATRADHERAAASLEFAQRLTAVADADADNPQPEDEHLEASDSPAYRCFVATFGAARRLGLPIYSDDREIRRIARQSGLRAFGTLAVVDALVEAERLTAEQRFAIRKNMLSSRMLGVHPSPAELQQLADAADWELSLELAVAMLDRGPWREGVVPHFYSWVTFLWAVFRIRPQALRKWVARFLDAAETARPDLAVGLQAQCLVTIALLSIEVDRPQFVGALLRALDCARPMVASTLGDPAYGGLAGVRILLERGYYRGPPVAARDLLIRAWLALPITAQPRTLELLQS